jgi:phage N-6-adenine-methyltransferase
MAAVVARFGPIDVDLAASEHNTKATTFISEATNSLSVSWVISGRLWLNPPFDNITPWAMKCAEESRKGASILFLTPASIGSEWFANYVFPFARVLALRPRLSFDGKNPYPKDCILSVYPGGPGLELWKWK